MGVLDFDDSVLDGDSIEVEESPAVTSEAADFRDNYVFFRHVLTNLDLLAQALQNLEHALSLERSEEAEKVLSLLESSEDFLNRVSSDLEIYSKYRILCEGALKGAAAIELQKNLQQLKS